MLIELIAFGLIFFDTRIILLEAEEMYRGKRCCCILGIANNTKEGVVIEFSGGRNGLIEGNTISKAVVVVVREQQ